MVRGQVSEAKGQRAEDKGRKTEHGRWKAGGSLQGVLDTAGRAGSPLPAACHGAQRSVRPTQDCVGWAVGRMMGGVARRLDWCRIGWPLAAGAVAVWGLCGCVSDRPQPSRRPPASVKGPIVQIHLLTAPTALDFDRAPGPDGFAVRVYATSPKTPNTVLISRGRLEVLMYDGLPGTNAADIKPRQVWAFSAEELKQFEVRSPIGVAYDLTLLWGQAAPTQPWVTLQVRYLPPSGPPLYSGSSAVSVAVK